MLRIKNGGIEAGFLRIRKDSGLIKPEEEIRLNYLESLPEDATVYLDENGQQTNEEEYAGKMLSKLTKFISDEEKDS